MIDMYYRAKYGFEYCIRFLVCIFSFITILVLQFYFYNLSRILVDATNIRGCLNGLLFSV